MSIFGSIMNAIFHHPAVSQTAKPSAAPMAAPASATVKPASATTPTPSQPATATLQPTPVDVEAVLTDMASKKGGGGNWKTSIVDLLKLLDLDASLAARKNLASELGVHAGGDGSAEENIALHKAVMKKLSENGGRVPASMKD